jgi:hypothetical protein
MAARWTCGVARPANRLNIRKSIYTLTDPQLQDLKDAVNAIKADGSYDDFIERHHMSMQHEHPASAYAPASGGPPDGVRCRAYGGRAAGRKAAASSRASSS